jgi:hypothetical protein
LRVLEARAARYVTATFLAVAVPWLAAPSLVRAEEKLETADGTGACRAFEAKNDRERDAFEKTQPPTPYQYPRDDDVLGAPWGKLFTALGGAPGGLLLATFVPHAGAQLRGTQPAALVSFPWSIPFGPAWSCSRKPGTLAVRVHRVHRALFEPGIVSGARGVGFFVRPGYRFIYHPSDWVVGAGGGLGSTVEIAGARERFRLSISPEAMVHFGHCCDASYFTLAFRYDRFFSGNIEDVLSGSLGYTFF